MYLFNGESIIRVDVLVGYNLKVKMNINDVVGYNPMNNDVLVGYNLKVKMVYLLAIT